MSLNRHFFHLPSHPLLFENLVELRKGGKAATPLWIHGAKKDHYGKEESAGGK